MARQLSFDPFDYLEQAKTSLADAASRSTLFPRLAEMTEHQLATWYARKARDAEYQRLKKLHPDLEPTRWVLKNQLEQYQSFGVDGRGWRDVYYITVKGI